MNGRWYLTLLLLAAGCARQPAPKQEASETPALRALGQSVTVEETRSDEAIGFEIRHRLATEIPGESAGVIIEVSDGIVTVRGAAPTRAAAWRVEATAHAVKGVKQVRNQIIVATGPPLP